MVTLHPSVHDSSIPLLSDTLLRNFMVNPVRIAPHRTVNFAKLCAAAGIILDGVYKLLIKLDIVQKNVRVIPPSVEMPLNRLD